MKYLLKNVENGQEHLLCENKEYVVGRKSCDILIEGDNSISRRHALIIKVNDETVTLTDCGAKYHTFVNDVELSPNTAVTLRHNDHIQFGALNSKYRFYKIQFVTTSSGISNATSKESLKSNINKAYGRYLEKWTPECTHLTIDKITLTIKLLLALIDNKPFVTPQFWSDYAKSIDENAPPPKEKDYGNIPVAELLLNEYDFTPNRKRNTLFASKMFVFSKEKVKQQMEDIIVRCGGECISWEESPILPNEIRTSEKEFLIIQTEETEKSVSLLSVIKEFAKDGKRTIPLSEIALAVVGCSCEKNCNPSFNKANEVLNSRNNTQVATGSRVLAPDTQSQDTVAMQGHRGQYTQEDVVIPATVDVGLEQLLEARGTTIAVQKNAGGSNKRPPDGEGEKTNVKKAKIMKDVAEVVIEKEQSKQAQPSHSQKRKASDNDIEPQPLKKPANKPNDIFAKPLLSNRPSTSRQSDDVDDAFNITQNPKKTQSKNVTLTIKTEPVDNPKSVFDSIKPIGKGPEKTEPLKSKKDLNTSTKDMVAPKKPYNVAKVVINPSLINVKTENIDNVYSAGCSRNTTKAEMSNVTWMSKSFDKNDVTIKTDDDELAEVEKLFKDCVKIEVSARWRLQASVCSVWNGNVSSEMDDSIGKKNFKKFKKVEILHAQSIIISRQQCIRVNSDDISEVPIMSDDETHDELMELMIQPIQPIKKENSTKKTVLANECVDIKKFDF